MGLGCTYVALFLTRTAQPALLYLVPTTLGSVAVLALCRRELKFFFTGKVRTIRTMATYCDCVFLQATEVVSGRKTGSVQADSDTDLSDREKETLIDNS